MKHTAFIAAFLGMFGLLMASRFVPGPGSKDIAGAWVGYDNEYPYFYRMTFNSDSSGNVVKIMPQLAPLKYEAQWKMSESNLLINIRPNKIENEVISMVVNSFNFRQMSVTFSGTTNRWKRSATLYKEDLLLTNIHNSSIDK